MIRILFIIGISCLFTITSQAQQPKEDADSVNSERGKKLRNDYETNSELMDESNSIIDRDNNEIINHINIGDIGDKEIVLPIKREYIKTSNQGRKITIDFQSGLEIVEGADYTTQESLNSKNRKKIRFKSPNVEYDDKIRYSNITEFGFIELNKVDRTYEFTTINGFSINGKNIIGFGIGIGVFNYSGSTNDIWYKPFFLNYRYCILRPQKTLTPYINVATGGILFEKVNGFYSTYTIGFNVDNLSFSTGFSFFGMLKENENFNIQPAYIDKNNSWRYFYGIVLKVGVAF